MTIEKMLNKEQKEILDKLVSLINKEQTLWLSGYLSGLAGGGVALSEPKKTAKIDKLTIIYATETGNSKKIAQDIAKQVKAYGVSAKVKASEQYKVADLASEKNLILVASTHGEGELPESAREFHQNIVDQKPDLSKLQYAIVALGDTSYPLFCQAGKTFDLEFQKLGAKSFLALQEFDVDFEEGVALWQKDLEGYLLADSGDFVAPKAQKVDKKASSKRNHVGAVQANILLNDVGSSKETYHIEISADEVDYLPGDSIGIKIGDNSPRLYSIASSPDYHEGEIHLTVAKTTYKDEKGEVKEGLCSGYLAGLKEGEEIEFYISKNNIFRLPQDEANIIMVGAGTGIAPFRSFLAQRDANKATGKNWLIFGDRNAHTDFLYQGEWQDYLAVGLLTRMDAAFSRDQEEKIYVQDKIKQHAVDIKNWLEEGAYFYICGDKKSMAKDVENCLEEIVGKEYLQGLAEKGRYLKDVY